MAKRNLLRVSLYRPPWRNGEPYFRAQQVAAYFRRRGDRVTVVTGPSGWRSLVRLLSWPWCLACTDLIFLYPQPLLPLFVLTARWLRRRVVIDHYVSYVRMSNVSTRAGRWLAPFESAAYRRVDAVLAHTGSVAEAVQAAHTLPGSKVHTIYSLVDTTRFAPIYDDEANRLRHKLDLTDRFIVLYHGMWHPWHGLETIRAAVARLAEAGEPVALVSIGQGGERTAHERLLSEVAYADLPPYIQMADVWCSGFTNQPRGDRSFSSTMIQALAVARPVITSPSPEKIRFLRDGEDVFFVPPDDPDALAEKIRYCHRHPGVARRVGRAGRRLAERTFDVTAFDDLLERLTDAWFG
jgi:glycosyltransferase involved in cell wall biosynthesis